MPRQAIGPTTKTAQRRKYLGRIFRRIPYSFKCSGVGEYPGRVGSCSAHGGSVGVRLPGRYDHDLLLGGYDYI